MAKERAAEAAILAALLLILVPLLATHAAPPNIDPAVAQALEAKGSAAVLVILKEQADLGGARALATKDEKGWFIYRALTATADRSQPPLRAYLEERGVPYRAYWIRNMIRVESSDAALIRELARRPEVDHIEYAQPDDLVPLMTAPAEPASQPAAVQWNIQRLRADDVWALGYDGAGVVVGVIDSGADWDHPALINSYRPWVSGAPSRHDYNWYDGPGGSQTPVDYSGHGTAVTGLITGDDGGANQIGMAPGANWIACNMLPPTNTALDCLQFMMAPTQLDGSDPRPDLAPHVLSNSWRAGMDYSDVIHTLTLAGIMFVKAGENEGPGCGNVHTPGHLREVTAVGAFQQGDTITHFSSRGPMMLDGELIIKPDVAAPGLECRTSSDGGSYTQGRGTSVACPHVAGAVALILSARPDLAGRIDTLQVLLNDTAEPIIDLQCGPNDPSGVPNNVWGHGIVDAYDAVLMAQGLGMGEVEGQVTDAGTGLPIPLASIGFEDDAGRRFLGTDVMAGAYAHTLPAAVYTATVETYGYYPGVAGEVVVSDGGLTIQDLSLAPRPAHVISGRVTRYGTPLSATLTMLHTPLDPVQTDPATGFFSMTVAEGEHILHVEALQHLSQERMVAVDQDRTETFALERIPYVPLENSAVLEMGVPGSWDSEFAGLPSVVHAGGLFYLFYLGVDSSGDYTIGYATSADGVNYTKYAGNPVLAADGTGFDAGAVAYPVITYSPPDRSAQSASWTLYYSGWESGDKEWKIGRATATSPSGPWTRGSDPVVRTGSYWEWDAEWVAADSVIRTGSSYVMYYTGDSYPGISAKIGLATSPDGITWTKYDDPGTPGAPFAESDPVLVASLPEAWDDRVISLCEVRPTEDGWEMFYDGNANTLSYLATGYATSADGVQWARDARNPIFHPKDDPVATQWLRKPAVVQVGDTDWMYHDDGGATILGAMRSTIPPAVAVEPSSLEAVLLPGERLTETLWISNSGGADLEFYLVEAERTLDNGLDWIATDPVYGIVAPGDGQPIDVVFDATAQGPGTYLGQLDVESSDPLTPTISVRVTLTVFTPCDPVADADFGWLPPEPTAGQVVTFTAEATGSPPITFTWDLGDGMTCEGSSVTHAYAVSDTYSVVLTATNACHEETVVHEVGVEDEELPCVPVVDAGFTWQPPAPTVGQVVTFTGEASGTLPITFTWAFGDGEDGAGAEVTHTYTLSDTFTVTLAAANDCGEEVVRRDIVVNTEDAYYSIYLPVVTRND